MLKKTYEHRSSFIGWMYACMYAVCCLLFFFFTVQHSIHCVHIWQWKTELSYVCLTETALVFKDLFVCDPFPTCESMMTIFDVLFAMHFQFHFISFSLPVGACWWYFIPTKRKTDSLFIRYFLDFLPLNNSLTHSFILFCFLFAQFFLLLFSISS